MADRYAPPRKVPVGAIGDSFLPQAMKHPFDDEGPIHYNHAHTHSMPTHHLDSHLCTYVCRRGLIPHEHREEPLKRKQRALATAQQRALVEQMILARHPYMPPLMVLPRSPPHEDEEEGAERDEE
jgi:hypothetical protein